MKKYLILLLLIIIAPINVFSLVSKSEYEYITDSSEVLTEETTNYIYEYSSYLNEMEDIDYYVVTVKDLDNYSIEDYADKVYKSFNISQKGILILLSTDERRLRIKVGEDLSDIIYPQLIDEYIEQFFMPYFKNGEWDEGIKNGYSSFYKMICNYYDIDTSEINVYDDNIFIKYKNYIIFLIIWFITLIGYIFSEYFFRLFMYKDKTNQNMDTVIFGVCLFISMLLLNLTYLIMPKALIIVLGFELIAIVSNIMNHTKKNDKQKKKKLKRKRKEDNKLLVIFFIFQKI